MPVILEDMQPTLPEEPIVEVLPQENEEQKEECQPERRMPTEDNEELKQTEWIMCTACSKWRILPPDANVAALHVQWTCGLGFQSKPKFDCDTPYDLDMPREDLLQHQE